MKTFKIDVDGDIKIDSHENIVMVEGPDEVVQAYWLLLSVRAGEWFLDTRLGLDYSKIWDKPYNPARIRAELIKALHQEPRTREVVDLELDFDRQARKLAITFKVITNDGETIFASEEVAL
ncbi:MAG: hypothetical protein WCY82_11650 [Desulfotomaculaceae bacterium]